jgi:adenosine/AMP kinase
MPSGFAGPAAKSRFLYGRGSVSTVAALPPLRSRLLVYAGFLMELKLVPLEIPEGGNLILGQSHFIKTVEDIYEAIVNTVPQMKFGVAFNEASGPCLTRVDGNDEPLRAAAARNATAIAAGHIFVVAMREGYPINVLGRIKDVPEVCSIYCATANPAQVVVAESEQGRGVMGVIDGAPPKGIETAEDAEKRRAFLRTIGYKR